MSNVGADIEACLTGLNELWDNPGDARAAEQVGLHPEDIGNIHNEAIVADPRLSNLVASRRRSESICDCAKAKTASEGRNTACKCKQLLQGTAPQEATGKHSGEVFP